MDVCLVIKQRLEVLGLEQRNLAAAAGVTESYISQLLTGKKSPPAPTRTAIYGRIAKFLKLPDGELAKLAHFQRREALKRSLVDPPTSLFPKVREMILHKCRREKEKDIRAIFEKQAFGELERLITQKLLDVVKRVAKGEMENEPWLRSLARLRGRSYEAMRATILEFLDADVFNVSAQNYPGLLDSLIKSWDIDLKTFGMEIVLNRSLIPEYAKKIEFVKKELVHSEEEPGLKEFLRLQSVSGDATKEEIDFLRSLRFRGRHPTPLYYYRELQNLRDPLHFRAAATQGLLGKELDPPQPGGTAAPMHDFLKTCDLEKQSLLDGRKKPIRHSKSKGDTVGRNRDPKPRNDSPAVTKRLL